MTPDHPLYAAADEMAKALTPEAVRKLKPLGLNRANRRHLSHLAQRGKLTPADIPAWLAARVLQYGATT